MLVQEDTKVINVKKKFIIEILGQIKTYWDGAKKIIKFVKTRDVDEEMLDNIISIITIAIEKTQNIVRKSHLESAILEIENIKNREKQEQTDEDEEAEKLLNSLDSLIEN